MLQHMRRLVSYLAFGGPRRGKHDLVACGGGDGADALEPRSGAQTHINPVQPLPKKSFQPMAIWQLRSGNDRATFCAIRGDPAEIPVGQPRRSVIGLHSGPTREVTCGGRGVS